MPELEYGWICGYKVTVDGIEHNACFMIEHDVKKLMMYIYVTNSWCK